eukprot:CAMPEP_0195528214 /NCGR_PEP_ID=MMETSP0794_2-20130614/30272_1 /TAXON_ID=515487 /ORGANISM="Stephanopyxis turris, Strain CCMP 815" /LENGTH=79 /DNA_ID=CAMNT_0040659307 /DNA_START=72 /DNA_END=311 /DNA_ORIENTATION=-
MTIIAAASAARRPLAQRAIALSATNSRMGAKRSMADHKVFEPPFNPAVTGGLAAFILFGGFGVMYCGVRHQQKKQGYWK